MYQPNKLFESLLTVAEAELEMLTVAPGASVQRAEHPRLSPLELAVEESYARRIKKTVHNSPPVFNPPEIQGYPEEEKQLVKNVELYFRAMEPFKDVPEFRLFLREALLPKTQWIYNLTTPPPEADESLNLKILYSEGAERVHAGYSSDSSHDCEKNRKTDGKEYDEGNGVINDTAIKKDSHKNIDNHRNNRDNYKDKQRTNNYRLNEGGR